MDKYKIELGSTIKKYRNAKKYSTQQLAKLLGVSVGRINHLEHDKNNVFKLDLLMQLINILDIPFEEIFSHRSIKIGHIEHKTDKIKICFDCKGIENAQELVNNMDMLVRNYIECASLYKFNKEAMSVLTAHLSQEIEFSKKLKNLAVL